MNKTTLITIFSLITALTFSQNKNSEATYRFYIQEEGNKKATAAMKEEQSAVEKTAKKVVVKLIFNDTKSMHFIEHGLNNPETNLNYLLALNYCKGKKPVYTDRVRGITCYNNYEITMFKDSQFLVTDSIPKWQLHNETKEINNYTCYKATYEKEYAFYTDVVLKTITAWYCPEFPYPYGPKGFSGLPGLIFEVQDDKTVIGIESIVLNNNNIEIALPTKGKVLKEIDYYLTLHNSIDEYMEYLKNKD